VTREARPITPDGLAIVGWRRDGDTVVVHVRVPSNTTRRILQERSEDDSPSRPPAVTPWA
jgi:hypothetical protein